MEVYYDIAEISRQAFHQWMKPSDAMLKRTEEETVLAMARNIRKNFLPGSSVREVYKYIRNKHSEYNSMLVGWGKHAFEAFCLLNGLRIESRRFFPKTTQRGNFIFPNRIEGMILDDINQIWVSDISYVTGTDGKVVGYATTLMDLYSRYLLGLHFSNSMMATDTSIPVLEQALETRKSYQFQNLFFHSDGGKQYIEKRFLSMLRAKNIQSSMAKNCYENPFAEALNDTIKNHMLIEFDFNSFHQLKKHELHIKNAYNFFKPHSGAMKLPPFEYEKFISNLQPCQRTQLIIKQIL